MAELAQEVLDGMVPALRDLMTKGIFTETEIHAIVSRRRQSEYLLRRRTARKADFLRYIEAEIALERLRSIRTTKLASGRITGPQKIMFDTYRRRAMEAKLEREEEMKMNNKNKNKGHHQSLKLQRRYCNIGDHSIIQLIHFIFKRAKMKWNGDVALHLEHASFARKAKSFKLLGRIYAEALQFHPRNVGIWIEAASHEFFGYDSIDDKNEEDGEEQDKDDQKDSASGGGGGSIRNARTLMQRGLRVNPHATDLWVQYFALEMHYIQKIRGRRAMMLQREKDTRTTTTIGGAGGVVDKGDDNLADSMEDQSEEDDDYDDDDDGQADLLRGAVPLVVYRNAIKTISDNVGFRLRFLDLCGQFPQTEELEKEIVHSIERDFANNADAWIARASYRLANGEEEEEVDGGPVSSKGFFRSPNDSRKGETGGDDIRVGDVGQEVEKDEDGEGTDSSDDGEDIVDGHEDSRKRKRSERQEVVGSDRSRLKLTFDILNEAMSSLGSPEMYVKVAHFLLTLLTEDEDDDDRIEVANYLGDVFKAASEAGIESPELVSLSAVYSMQMDRRGDAAKKLWEAVHRKELESVASLWLQLSEVLQQAEDSVTVKDSRGGSVQLLTPLSVLKKASRVIPIHDPSHLDVLLALFHYVLFTIETTEKESVRRKHAKTASDLFQRILLLRRSDVANVCVTYLNHASRTGGISAAREVYNTVLYRSNLCCPPSTATAGGKAVAAIDLRTFFDRCISLEQRHVVDLGDGKMSVNAKKEREESRMRLKRIFDVVLTFYTSRKDRENLTHFKEGRAAEFGHFA